MTQGLVKSAAECRPIAGVQVAAFDARRELLGSVTTNTSGAWRFDGLAGVAWLQFHKPGFGTRLVAHQDVGPWVRLLEDRIIGYQNKLWFYPGEGAQVFVHAPTPYRARLFRHGMNKELVLDLGERRPHRREVPDSRWVASGLPWTPSWEYLVPANLRPGLYSLRLESAGQAFAIPLVIATSPLQRGRRTPLAVLASTITWQAYNFYGGRSKYMCWEEQPTAVTPFIPSWGYHLKQRIKELFLSSRLRQWLRRIRCVRPPDWQVEPLSVRRPFTHSGMEVDSPFSPFTNHLAGGEWRLLAWLEREGLEYDFIAGEELHACPDLLSHYGALILNTHCEYVSKEMFAGLYRFHMEQGGWLLNLSGNSLYCEVEITRETMRFVGGLFMDTCADETSLLGVRFTRDDLGTCAPYCIKKPDHWCFAGIDVPADGCFGRGSLNQDTPRPTPATEEWDPSRPGESTGLAGQGASGWETDKRSDTAPKDIAVIAKGVNRFGGADMVIREPAEERGGMFSASSIAFSGSLLVDEVASQLVKNVLQRAVPGVRRISTPSAGEKRVA
jgi:hypothetical protein